MKFSTHQEILKKINYYIEYKYNADHRTAYIYISWLNKTFYLKWDNKQLFNSYDEKFYNINKEYVLSIVYVTLQKICQEFKYPIRWVVYKSQENEISKMVFDILEYEDDVSRSNDLLDITKDIVQYGLKPEHIVEAQTFNVSDGLQVVLASWANIHIDYL